MSPSFFTKLTGPALVTLCAMSLSGCPTSPGTDPVASNNTPGGAAGGGTNTTPDPTGPRTRYSFNNRCYALLANDNGNYVSRNGNSYTADATAITDAEPFFFKPTALGRYMLYNSEGTLLAATPGISNVTIANASPVVEWTVKATGDATIYPAAPVFDVEPDPTELATYLDFGRNNQKVTLGEPNILSQEFTLASAANSSTLIVDGSNNITTASGPNGGNAESFTMELTENCAEFPEAQNNTVGETFSGPQFNAGAASNGKNNVSSATLLGYADAHVHISATTFLGGVHSGRPFHEYGVEHAIGDCAEEHGPDGAADPVGALFVGDTDGHITTGWPTFQDWPARGALTHEGMYWKWVERSWKAGQRLMVNDLVDNATLCELQRNANQPPDPTTECNEMDGAADQAGFMYAMQDYVDAQYGGRGAGWFQIVHSPAEARQMIAAGKMAVVLGIEISHIFNCQVFYNNPARQQEPFEETGNPLDAGATYTCNESEIDAQIDRLWNIGVRQLFPIHEFDNALGGNGIFDGLILNLGNRSDTGGTPSPADGDPFGNNPTAETAAGEFWTTYTCPAADDVEIDGYLYGAGSVMENAPPRPLPCVQTGQGGRAGGTTQCYPDTRQCNARWLTPIGQYAFEKLMERGMIIEVDHLELEIKDQLLELAEAQTPTYPLVSTHGGHGGISNVQARRILNGGGIIYPYKPNGQGLVSFYQNLLQLHSDSGSPYDLAIGYGADMNGLGGQSAPRGDIQAGKEVAYPFTLFSGPEFDSMPEFASISPVVFQQPGTLAPDGSGRTWSIDEVGIAHYGLIADFVEEVRQEGGEPVLRALFNSAEVFVQMWERTNASSTAINNGAIVIPNDLLRAAPTQ